MNVGTPVVLEALISLKHQGFVRRVNNRGSFVIVFDPEETRQLYALRIELETLAFQVGAHARYGICGSEF